VLVTLLAGCGRIGFDPNAARGDGGATSGDGVIAGGDGAAAGSDAPGDTGSGTGSGTISGTAPDGKEFTTLVAGYVIGHPKFAGETSIYMFSQPIRCSDLGVAGWGAWITAGTQCMELQLPANAPGTYTVQASEPPPAQSGFGRYRYGEGSGGELTGDGMGGQVMVTSNANGSVAGSFTVSFPLHGPLVGTFTAVACPTGYYPTFP
jgi:hypothetical protein